MSTRMNAGKIGLMMVLMAVLAVTGGCAKKNKDLQVDTGTTATGPAETTSGSGQPELDLESILFDKATGLQTVYFDFDSSALREDARETLKRNAEMIKQYPGVLIQIEGHCDERGTQEYNMALGERRALAVRDYLIQLGIGGDRLVTISYGEEMPAVPGSDESAWAKNRRGEFNRARAK